MRKTSIGAAIALILALASPAWSQVANAKSARYSTAFMGHNLGETVEQWFRASDEPKRCAEWNMRKANNVQFCKAAYAISQGGSGYLNTRHPGGSVLARDRWVFDHGTLAALVANALPYEKTLAQVRERYGRETNDRTIMVVHVFGPSYPVAGNEWTMQDGTVIVLAEDRTAIHHAKLLISSRGFIRKQVDASNPF
ncbi:MAG: hypothetical protein ACRD8A_06810 [Candidatus Acidiferrales bacterium]